MTAVKTIVDTSLSVLLVAGLCGPTVVRAHKRLKQYDLEDYRLLQDRLSGNVQAILSPNVLTETSNFLRQISEPMRGRLVSKLAEVVMLHDEHYVPARNAIQNPAYRYLGLTDAVLLELLIETRGLLLTDDHVLHQAAILQGLNAENFSHLRDRRNDWS